jgi:transglutaminase-like putative cysteine protease
MIYDIRQTTSYSYASPVAYADHVLRLTPVNRSGQRVYAAALDVEPRTDERREGVDFFGNHMTWIALKESHASLTIKVAARIAVETPADVAELETPAWEDLRQAVAVTRDIDASSPAHFLFPSRMVSLDPDTRDYAEGSFSAGQPVLAGALDLMHRIKADFAYEPGATTVATTSAMAFALRRGVCQDFAHVMISALRGLGLPAAYVSGYLRTIPRPGQPRLEGVDAMHAWVMVWCGGEVGWRGLDPTNAIAVSDDHVTLAVGRDYADVSPIDGVVFAAGRHRLAVSVTVTAVGGS